MTNDPALTATPPEDRRRLTRAEQLTLTTWRWAFVTLCRQVEPQDLLPQVALQAVLARLRDYTDSLQLFGRHGTAAADFALVASLLPERGRRALDHDLVDSAFLLRWNELTADGTGPEELPPLTSRRPATDNSADAPTATADDRPWPSLPDQLRAAWISDASAPSSRP
ncbi:MAG: hypothetical protein JOZ87_03585 [Chloroflexi bacterium]|nr:hypothetical protein [Chloroflexota bacterium]